MALVEMNFASGGGNAPIKVYSNTSSAPEGTSVNGNKEFTFSDFTEIRGVAINNNAALYASAVVNDDDTISRMSYGGSGAYLNVANIDGNKVTVYANGAYSLYFQVVGN